MVAKKQGTVPLEVLSTPGHTLDSMSYLIRGQGVFVGDTLFAEDIVRNSKNASSFYSSYILRNLKGSARCDFPNGCPQLLYKSLQRILSLEDETKIYFCHDYPEGKNRTFKFETTVKEQKEYNIHVKKGITEEEYVKMRSERDKTLAMPKLFYPSVQINILAGRLPDPEDNGVSFVKLPIKIKQV